MNKWLGHCKVTFLRGWQGSLRQVATLGLPLQVSDAISGRAQTVVKSLFGGRQLHFEPMVLFCTISPL